MLSAAITTIGFNVAAYNLDYADTNYSVWLEDYSGSVRHDTALYLSGTDGIKLNGAAVPLCYKMTASANVMPLEGLWRVIVNEVTTSQTATLEIIHNEAAALNDGEIWLELEYPVTGGSAQFARLTDKSNLLATPATQTTSSADWDDGLSERANSTVYAVGNIIKSSGSPGSAFICTVSGTSAGSVPGGYTSAADGASITDGSATFKAMRRQKLQVPFTAAEQGVIRARAVLAKSNAVVWVASKLAVA
ncbi:hypothetical protein EBAPG3_010455 [Nitrosospira lacus]|uniref:Uncharacterized protein n=1 Tax=Nitrosospira lacus TaxID=1288494 RepID=A0A1W6SQV1_9PROT|nr:hypothetical protein [Nitrosospira lacus]ARO88163.1 hypothetical protein EBAPG3_010455 [Nitrosospira lacus]